MPEPPIIERPNAPDFGIYSDTNPYIKTPKPQNPKTPKSKILAYISGIKNEKILMKDSLFVVILALLSITYCDWTPSQTIHHGNIVAHSVFVDKSNNKTHIVYTEKVNKNYIVFYMNLLPNGTPSTPIQLSKLESLTIPPKITGEHDGKSLYATMNQLRDGISEIFFVESETDGVYWTKPVVPRSDNPNDKYHRYSPNIVVTKSERVFIFYRMKAYSHYLYYSTRAQSSVIWSTERSISKDCHANDYNYSIDISFASNSTAEGLIVNLM